MEKKTEHIERLKNAVVAAFGQTLDSPTDYERLSVDIQSKTGELISVSTLKRMFGYLKQGTVPRPSTLSVLARYVGFSGWSDFCSGEECSEPCKVSKKAVCRRPIVCVAVVILCISIGWIVWRSQQPSQNSYAGGETPSVVMVSDSEETNEQKYERLLISFVTMANGKCDSVRACRQNMDIISYKKLVDSVYFPFVFTLLQDSIKRQVERVFPDDELLKVRYSNDIFAQCREICVELMREIPADELLEAYNKRKTTLHSTSQQQ